jgi:hypothetical protein
MATYLQGVNDYISQVQPTAPNLAFDAQILQTKQAKYDANHKKVSELYGSLLNSGMTRTDNIKARDEFFKIINDDIQRMGSMDFSLDQNVDAAASVFQSVYNNKSIVKDMVWTKNFNDQAQRGEAFKNCTDPEKCGGQWWEEGDKYMAYKKQEFKNASADEAMGFGDVKYIPYNNIMGDAMKNFKEAGLSVELDRISGNYKLTTKNGTNLISPLTSLFNQTIGKDPKFAEMYQAKAYVTRNDWAYNKVNMGEYADVNEAQMAYFQNINKENQKKIDNASNDLHVDRGSLDQKIAEKEILLRNGIIKEGSDEFKNLEQLKVLKSNADSAQNYVEQLKTISESANPNLGIRTMGDLIDQQNAFVEFNNDINSAANTLAFKDYQEKLEADDFALKAVDHKYKLSEMAAKFGYDVKLENLDHQNNLEMQRVKNSKKDDVTLKETTDLNTKIGYVNAFNPSYSARAAWAKATGAQIPTEKEMQIKLEAWKKEGQKSDIERWKKFEVEADTKLVKVKQAANVAALKAGEILPYREALTLNDLENDDLTKWKVSADDTYANRWYYNTYKMLLKKNKNLTSGEFNAAIKKVSQTEPLYPQLEELLVK